MKNAIIVLFLAFWGLSTIAQEMDYMTNRTGFDRFAITKCYDKNRSTNVGERYLCDENKGTVSVINTDERELTSKYFKYYVRGANQHNKPGKSYKVTDAGGATKKVANTYWGTVFDYVDDRNYMAATISCFNSNLYDFTDKRSACLKVTRIVDGVETELASKNLDKDLNLYDGLNSVCVLYDGKSELQVSVGDKHWANTIYLYNLKLNGGKLGYVLGPGAKVNIERAVLECRKSLPDLSTQWTKETLDKRFSRYVDLYEGYWSYLDRETNDVTLKLGGRYDLALVKTDTGYDIIYVGNAEVCADLWQCGMLKGRLTGTLFEGNYDLLWYDAEMNPFKLEVYATLTNEALLTLFFPEQNSQLRFVKKGQK